MVYSFRDQGVGGSNPLSPATFKEIQTFSKIAENCSSAYYSCQKPSLGAATPFVPVFAVGAAELIEVAPGIWQLAQQGSFTDFASGFLQGISPGGVAASSMPEAWGIVTGEIVSSWSTIKGQFCALVNCQ